MSEPQENVENIAKPAQEQRSELGRGSSESLDRSSGAEDAAIRAGGQGGVRNPSDGRLRDNLTPEQRREIGRKGGQAVSRNREHMASIGRKGGVAVSENREHMAEIGRKGGRA